MGIEPQAPGLTLSAGDELPAFPEAPYPDDRCCRPDVESLGGLPSRQPTHGRVDDALAKIRTVCPSHSGPLVRGGKENRNDQEEQPLYVEFVFSKNALVLSVSRCLRTKHFHIHWWRGAQCLAGTPSRLDGNPPSASLFRLRDTGQLDGRRRCGEEEILSRKIAMAAIQDDLETPSPASASKLLR